MLWVIALTDTFYLAADIGGTNARFALVRPGQSGYSNEKTLSCIDYVSPEAAIRSYLDSVGAGMPELVCFAVAGPIDDGTVEFTNSSWRIEEKRLVRSFNLSSAKLINDFAAIALAIPIINEDELDRIGNNLQKPAGRDDFCFGVIGPGTGLGAAGLLGANGFCKPILTEAGHAGFAPMTSLQAGLHGVLSSRFGRVSNERLISGPGLENIYSALGELNRIQCLSITAGDIFEAAIQQTDDLAVQSVDLFFEVFGQVAGDFALSIGAFDGLYLTGGVIQRYGEMLRKSRFRQAFEDKGRLNSQLRKTPSKLILHPQPGLLGASEMARAMANIH
jgi:glucokinase